MTPEPWERAVEEHRDAIERWADSDLPLSDEFREMLSEADEAAALEA